MTYLNLVNNILRRLREDTVASVTETDYSTMVGDFVNDAKRIVEEAYQWAALRSDVDVATVASTSSYTLTGVGTDAKVLDVFNEDLGIEVREQSPKWYRRTGAASGNPTNFVYDGLDSNGDIKVKLHPTPDDVYTIAFSVCNPQADLSADSDVLLAPDYAVLHLALAMLVRERGETGGTSAAEHFQIADRFLRDAIAREAARHEDELIFFTV